MMKKVLIVDNMHESILPLLREVGYDPVYLPHIEWTEIINILYQFHGIITRSKTHIDKKLIDACPQLEFVARAGAGLDNIDCEYLQSKSIKIINAPEGNRDALGEHTLGMLLSLLHHLHSANNEVKEGIWQRERNRGTELASKVVGIYGVGNMGTAFAQKLRGMGCKIIGYDKYLDKFDCSLIEKTDLKSFMKQVEILSLHIPLQADTEYLFNFQYFKKFSKIQYFLNTSRGKIVKTSDLIQFLDQGNLKGVALDVIENENIKSLNREEKQQLKILSSKPNVILTPHIAGWTFESYKKINKVIIEKIKSLNFQ